MRRRLHVAALPALCALLAVGLAGCGDDDDGSSAAPNSEMATTMAITETPARPTSTSTAAASEEAVLEAYGRYWAVYSDALVNLDDSRLSEVMTGAELGRTLREIEDLRARNRAVRIVVDNNPVVLEVSADSAVVFDEYTNRSYLIDAMTQASVGSEPQDAEVLRDTFEFARVDDSWKVVDSARQASGQ